MRTVACAQLPWETHASAWAAVHSQGHAPVKALKRWTTRTLWRVMAGLKRRAACWRHQPEIIASKRAGSGRNGVAPSTSTSDAEPASLATWALQSLQAPEASKWQQVQRDQVTQCCSWCGSSGGWSA